MTERKSLAPSKEVFDRLKSLKGDYQTWDGFLNELADLKEAQQPGDWREEIQTRDGDGDTCPECGHELVDSLGRDRPACPSCGWSE